MKIAFFWTWEFSKNILDWITYFKKLDIKLVVSQPDKPIWRNNKLEFTEIKKYALNKQLVVLQPLKLKNNQDFFNILKKLDLDFIIVVAYWKIIPEEVLNIPKYWCINIHGSILPKYRWASPVQEAIKNWDKETWLTIMYMSKWMDEWDILDIQKIKINKNNTSLDIFKKFEDIWPKLLLNTLIWIIDWKIKWKSQSDGNVSYCNKISKEDWEISFKNENWIDIYNKYKAYIKWPWIYTKYNDKKINIDSCILKDYYWNEDFWKVVKIDKKNIWIVCKWEKILILNKIKLEWKKSLDILSFINWEKNFIWYKFS
jgi:methionyl-tRNA formyltransferase